MNCLNVPNSDIYLVDGDIVMLTRFPSIKWIVHYGWYTYDTQQQLGWYFCSIPDNQIIPANDLDLQRITVISRGNNCHCPPPPYHCHPSHCHPYPPMPDRPDKLNDINRAFITLDNLDQRDRLAQYPIPNGRLVRVNDVDGSPKYYEWDKSHKVWNEMDFFNSDSDIYWSIIKEDKK